GQHAIHHVDAEIRVLGNFLWSSHPHQITGLVGGEVFDGGFHDLSRVTVRGSPTLRPPMAYPGKAISTVRSADSLRSLASIPPCTIPKRAWVAGQPGAAAPTWAGAEPSFSGFPFIAWFLPETCTSKLETFLAPYWALGAGDCRPHGTSCLCSAKYFFDRCP